MEIKSRFDHFNINVTDLERSIAFYGKALGLKEHHRKEASDSSFILVYLTDHETGFLLELTWLKDHTAPDELGENESHLCLDVYKRQPQDNVRDGFFIYKGRIMKS